MKKTEKVGLAAGESEPASEPEPPESELELEFDPEPEPFSAPVGDDAWFEGVPADGSASQTASFRIASALHVMLPDNRNPSLHVG